MTLFWYFAGMRSEKISWNRFNIKLIFKKTATTNNDKIRYSNGFCHIQYREKLLEDALQTSRIP